MSIVPLRPAASIMASADSVLHAEAGLKLSSFGDDPPGRPAPIRLSARAASADQFRDVWRWRACWWWPCVLSWRRGPPTDRTDTFRDMRANSPDCHCPASRTPRAHRPPDDATCASGPSDVDHAERATGGGRERVVARARHAPPFVRRSAPGSCPASRWTRRSTRAGGSRRSAALARSSRTLARTSRSSPRPTR